MLSKNGPWAACVLGVGIILSGGCDKVIEAIAYPSVADVKEFARKERELQEAHGRDMTKQHGKMHPEVEGELRAINAEFQRELERIGKETDAIQGTVVGLVEDVLTRFASLPEGASIAEWVNSKAEKQGDKVRHAIAKTKSEVMAAAKERLDQLDVGTREKLENLSNDAEAMAELVRLKGDDVAFRAELQKQANLTDKQMEALKGFSTEEIIAMLMAAGGATAAGGALGKTGKSRSHADIEKLKDAISDITTAAARVEPSPFVEAIVKQGAPPPAKSW